MFAYYIDQRSHIETTQYSESMLPPSQIVTGLIKIGLMHLKKILLALFLSEELIVYPKCAHPKYCIKLPDSIESNKNCLRDYVLLIHFDWIREGKKSTSKKLEDIYESDSWSCASQMSS